MIDLAKALGWPIAIVIVSFVTLAIVWRLTNAAGSFKIGFKDWLNLERDSPEGGRAVKDLAPVAPIKEVAGLEDISEDSRTSAETLDEVLPSDVSRTTFFTLEESPDKLEEAFEKFKLESSSYKDDQDFWESLYVDRRKELGIGDEESELRSLANANPSWIWPLIFLIRRYIRLHDSNRAEDALAQGLARSGPETRKWVLKEGVALHHSFFGRDRAVRFIYEQISRAATEIEIATMFWQLGHYGVRDDPFISAMATELAHSLKPDVDRLFDIAFNYGAVGDFGVIAFERYRELKRTKSNVWNSANNMGVILSGNRSVEISYFEESVATGSPIAISNLARQLASDGYVKRAQFLLDAISHDNQDVESLAVLADARAKVAAAQVTLDKERKKFEDFSASQDRRFKALVFAAYDYFRQVGHWGATGAFISSDRTLGIVVAKDSARCVYKLPDRLLGGEIQRKPLCFEGTISGSGGGGLLDYSFRRVLAVQISNDEVRVIIWPRKFDLSEPLQIVELKKASGFSHAVSGESELSEEGAARILEAPKADSSTAGDH